MRSRMRFETKESIIFSETGGLRNPYIYTDKEWHYKVFNVLIQSIEELCRVEGVAVRDLFLSGSASVFSLRGATLVYLREYFSGKKRKLTTVEIASIFLMNRSSVSSYSRKREHGKDEVFNAGYKIVEAVFDHFFDLLEDVELDGLSMYKDRYSFAHLIGLANFLGGESEDAHKFLEYLKKGRT